MHNDNNIDAGSAEKKSEIITFYNSTKSGVDTVDESFQELTSLAEIVVVGLLEYYFHL